MASLLPAAASARVPAFRTLRSATTAFLCCDVQEKTRPHVWRYSHVITTAKKMQDVATLFKIPFIICEHVQFEKGETVHEIDASRADLIAEKTKFSMYVPEVAKFLEEKMPNDTKAGDRGAAVLFGIEAHICILQTALDLLAKGYRVAVLADGISSMHRAEIKIALDHMAAAGAIITTAETVVYQLLSDSEHDLFREWTEISKKHEPASDKAMNELVSEVYI
ncbi:hypothetical protein HDU86_002485 [Geranomyces michiganensis]|nr:hypothetical protein HDU86_002485 [Geranomyces michiganensis]